MDTICPLDITLYVIIYRVAAMSYLLLACEVLRTPHAKWRQREGTADASHRPHRIHATLSPVQEQIFVVLR